MPPKRLKIHLRSRDILYFLHLPATGGMAFFTQIAQHFAPATVRSLPDWPLQPDQLTYTPDDFTGIRLVRGQFDYNFFHRLPRMPLYITWLREPVTRVVALHRQITGNPTHPLHTQIGQLSLAQFVEHPLFAVEGSNAMTRRLAAAAFPDQQTVSDAVLLEMAQVNLDEMAYFGLAEEARFSLALLAYTFGWPVPKPNTPLALPAIDLSRISAEFPWNENSGLASSELASGVHSVLSTQYSALFSQETLAQIRGRNELDIALYQFARQVWQHRLHQMVEELLSPVVPVLPAQDWLYPLRQWRWRWLPEGTRRGRVYHRLTHWLKPNP